MDTERALQFLRDHQPMPPDDRLRRDEIAEYDEVRRFFQEVPCEQCIPLFLNSFGDGSGFGVYQLVEDVLARFSTASVVPHLAQALRSREPGVRSWAAEIASVFPADDLCNPLQGLLDDEHEDVRESAVFALGQINSPRAREILHAHSQRETDPSVLTLLREFVDS